MKVLIPLIYILATLFIDEILMATIGIGFNFTVATFALTCFIFFRLGEKNV